MEDIKLKHFIEKSIKKHGYKYNYNKVDYINTKTKVIIQCPIHGEFLQLPKNHQKGCGCPKCANNEKYTKEFFLELAFKKHGKKYDYTSSNYINSKTPIIIKCPVHGEFKQTPNTHYKCGCQKCFLENSKKTLTNEKFLEKANKIHDSFYIYDSLNYVKGQNKIKIICPIHGEFEQKAYSHLSGKGCPICKKSKGEQNIRLWLIENKINFLPQHKFDDCISEETNRKLPFDFYLPDYNICIEFDGKQHFEPVKRFGGINGFNNTLKNDKIKTNYCFGKKINLIRISYKEDIYDKLKKVL